MAPTKKPITFFDNFWKRNSNLDFNEGWNYLDEKIIVKMYEYDDRFTVESQGYSIILVLVYFENLTLIVRF